MFATYHRATMPGRVQEWFRKRRDAEANGENIAAQRCWPWPPRPGRRFYELSAGVSVFSWGIGLTVDEVGAVLTIGPAWLALTVRRWSDR